MLDKANHEGATGTDVGVATLTMLPGAKLLKTAAPAVAKIIKADQAVLGAGASAASTAIAAEQLNQEVNGDDQTTNEREVVE